MSIPGDKLRGKSMSGRPMPVTDAIGEFDYHFTTMPTDGSTLTVTGRAVSYSVIPTAGECSFNINGGDTITVRSGKIWNHGFRTRAIDPVFNRVSGTFDLIVEFTDR